MINPDDCDENKREPLVEAEGNGGSGDDKPRRPTGVGTGGFDDDDDENYLNNMYDLHHFGFDAAEQDSMKAEETQSWPIPGLTFVRIDCVSRSWELEQEQPQREQLSGQQIGPGHLPERLYLMEAALTGLNSQKAYCAYAIIGSKTGVNYYMGMSLESKPQGIERDDLGQTCYDIQKSILNSVFYNAVQIDAKVYSSADMKAMIAPRAGNVGIVAGASLKEIYKEKKSESIERIVSSLQGEDFGMLVLAAPIPPRMVSDEELHVLDELGKARNNQDKDNKKRTEYFAEMQEVYLKHTQLGEAIGHWMVGFYFFAARPDIFVRLSSLIRNAYTNETSQYLRSIVAVRNSFPCH